MWCAWGVANLRYHTDQGKRRSGGWSMRIVPYDIPLRTLCSKDTPNLFVGGRLTDGDSYAGGSLRVTGNLFRDRTCGWRGGGGLCAITRK